MKPRNLIILITLMTAQSALAHEPPVHVNVDNFVRAETSSQIERFMELFTDGKINTWAHLRVATPLDRQTVIRMNRDTIYSAAVIDITKGATLTVPDAGGRYMSIMVVNEDHYLNKVFRDAGTYELTMDEFHTPYIMLNVRILINSNDPEDIKIANALQDQISTTAKSAIPYKRPNYDDASFDATKENLLDLSRGVPDLKGMFGTKEEVNDVRHLLGTAYAWGGLPEREATYLNFEPNLPIGEYQLNIKDVPVDAFWSITVYNRDGYLEENEYNSYNVNNITGEHNDDGSITVNFGGDPKAPNYLHIMEGWNYTVRLYQPGKEILDGSWTFPAINTAR